MSMAEHETQMRADWQELWDREQRERDALWAVIDQHAELFRANWHFADGEGGMVIAELHRRFTPPRSPRAGYRRPSHGDVKGAKRTRVMERDQYRCVECGTHLALTIDHIVPLVQGGSSDEDNLRTLCRSCNSRKGDR